MPERGGANAPPKRPPIPVAADGPLEERRRALLRRAEALPPPWRWPERLALAGLGGLLASPVLPWAGDPAREPLWLGDAGLPGGLLAAIVAAAVVVPAQLTVAPRREGVAWLTHVVGLAAVIAALVVRDGDDETRQLLVAGRLAAVAGGVALAAAAWGIEQAAADRRRAMDRLRPLARRNPPPSIGSGRTSVIVDDALRTGTWSSNPRGAGWVGAAFVLVVAGAATLAGPWWRGSSVAGPYEPSSPSEPVLGEGEAAWTFRSGIEALGGARSWAVAGVVMVAAAAVVWLGTRRRAARVVLAAGAFVLGLAVVTLSGAGFGAGAGGVAGPIVAAGAGALGVAVAGVVLLRSSPARSRRAVPLLVAVPGLLAATWAAVGGPPPPGRDGPYRVLLDAPPEHARTTSFDGAPAAETFAENVAPVWVDGRPGAVGLTVPEDAPSGLALWALRDGRVDVRSLVGSDFGIWAIEPSRFEVRDDGTLLWRTLESDRFGVRRSAILPLARGGPASYLPQGTEEATFGPDGQVWMWGAEGEAIASGERATWSPGTVYMGDVDELARPETESTTIDEWPRLPRSEPDDGVVPADGEGGGEREGGGGDGGDPAGGADGSQRPVLGGAVDQTCGLNRQASTSYVEEDWAQVDDAYDAYPRITDDDQRRAAAPDGGLWAALPTAEPDDGRYVLGKVDPDGTLRLVDHELPSIEAIALSPDGRTVLLVDTRGRLLELRDAEAALEPAPPLPEGCYPEAPQVAPAARVTELDVPDDGTLLDTAGTRLVWPQPQEGAMGPSQLTRVAADGSEALVAEDAQGSRLTDIVPDGAGGAWWLETTETTEETTGEEAGGEPGGGAAAPPPFDARPVHLLADGTVVRSQLTLRLGPRPIATWADGDLLHVLSSGTIWRVEGNRADVLEEGLGVQFIDPTYDTVVVTRGGDVIVQRNDDNLALFRVVDDRLEPLVGDVVVSPDEGRSAVPGEVADAPHRPLAAELAAGTRPGRIHVQGPIVADPAGDGVLLVQDGLLARVTRGGRVVPLAQDERLDQERWQSLHVVVLDGRLVVQPSEDGLEPGPTLVVEVPR